MRTSVDGVRGGYWYRAETMWQGADNSRVMRPSDSYSSPDLTRPSKLSGMGCHVARMGAFRISYRE
jgi:hypothetical protein